MIAVVSMPIFSCWGLQNNCLLHNFAEISLSDLFKYIYIVLFICKYKTLSPNHKTLGSFFMFFSTQPSWFWGCQPLQWSLPTRKAHELPPGTNLKPEITFPKKALQNLRITSTLHLKNKQLLGSHTISLSSHSSPFSDVYLSVPALEWNYSPKC